MLHDSHLLRLIYQAIKRSKWESWSISCYLCPGLRHIILALNTVYLNLFSCDQRMESLSSASPTPPTASGPGWCKRPQEEGKVYLNLFSCDQRMESLSSTSPTPPTSSDAGWCTHPQEEGKVYLNLFSCDQRMESLSSTSPTPPTASGPGWYTRPWDYVYIKS